MTPLSQPDTAENRLKDTVFIVEADSFAQYALWCDHAKESLYPPYNIRKGCRAYPLLKWEQVNPGWLVTVGKIDKMPCCISVSWARIEGHLVMFWYECSQVTDGRKAAKWLEKHFKGTYDGGTRRASCDAWNFAHCRDAIRELNEDHNVLDPDECANET